MEEGGEGRIVFQIAMLILLWFTFFLVFWAAEGRKKRTFFLLLLAVFVFSFLLGIAGK